MKFELLQPGLFTTLQDAGRPGFAHLGIGASGAFDVPAMRIANALCGNAPDACVIEMTLTGVCLRCDCDAWIAVTGAPLALQIDAAPQSMWAPLHLARGSTLSLGAMTSGCRSYLAVHGGFSLETILGSRSTDANAALGPFDGRALRAGDVLPIATTAARRTASAPDARWSIDPRPWFRADPDLPLRLLPGTHLERLTRESRSALFSQAFTVAAASNRVGLRLAGPALAWAKPIEMVSEGCIPGVLQLPPSGQPIGFGPECPVSGGYPRIGQIAAADLPRLAQLRPGAAVRFTPCTFAASVGALYEREQALTRLETNIAARLDT